MDKSLRLQKYISECGIASRRKAEELILRGAVKVNGRIPALGDKVDPKHDTVTVHGKKIISVSHKVYIMLNKPRGYITTMQDEQGRKCVAELVDDVGERVYPVGRLDRDSEGLLLLTNDGDFSNLLMHPRNKIGKTYRVTVRPPVTEDQLSRLTQGMMLDGAKTLPCEVNIIEQQENRIVLKIVLYEGKNRQIRRMCEQVGLEVARLKRTTIGAMKLGMLPVGKWRELSEQEIKGLKGSCVKSEDSAEQESIPPKREGRPKRYRK